MSAQKAILRRVTEVPQDVFLLPEGAYVKLAAAQESEVTIDGDACEGYYYDITLEDGTKYEAISAYHLDFV